MVVVILPPIGLILKTMVSFVPNANPPWKYCALVLRNKIEQIKTGRKNFFIFIEF
jgi:hypothetical protein